MLCEIIVIIVLLLPINYHYVKPVVKQYILI